MSPRLNHWLRILTAVPLGIAAILFLIFIPNAHVTMCMVAAIGYSVGLPMNRYEEKFARLASFFSGGILFYTIYVGTSLLLYDRVILGGGPSEHLWFDPAWWYHLLINISIIVLFVTKRDRMPHLLGGMAFFMIAAPFMLILQSVLGRELWGSVNNVLLYTSLGVLLLAVTQLLARFAPQFYLNFLPKLRTVIIASLLVYLIAQLISVSLFGS